MIKAFPISFTLMLLIGLSFSFIANSAYANPEERTELNLNLTNEIHEIVLFLNNLEEAKWNLSRVFPVMIDQIEILTKSEAQSRYGSRGAEGALVIRHRPTQTRLVYQARHSSPFPQTLHQGPVNPALQSRPVAKPAIPQKPNLRTQSL
ncbi:MAG: hypothetical protein LAT67_14735 [Balneolales bacterium]|nr:hypothetical protein [Balneolales bacterium]